MVWVTGAGMPACRFGYVCRYPGRTRMAGRKALVVNGPLPPDTFPDGSPFPAARHLRTLLLMLVDAHGWPDSTTGMEMAGLSLQVAELVRAPDAVAPNPELLKRLRAGRDWLQL